MKLIPLTKGKFAIVDEEDFEFLSQWKWTLHKQGYAKRSNYVDGKNQCVLMHRVIMDTSPEMEVDHIDHNTLNNQKSNLRNVTSSQNKINRRGHGVSNFKGVYWHNQRNKWAAQIKVGNKRISLGLHTSELEAAKAYNSAATKYHGEFAYINEGLK